MKIPKANIPEGKSGEWEVKKFTVSEEEASLHNLRCAINFQHGREIDLGEYTIKKFIKFHDTNNLIIV